MLTYGAALPDGAPGARPPQLDKILTVLYQ